MWGAIVGLGLQALGMSEQANAQADELRKQKDLTKKYQAAFNDYSTMSNTGERQQEKGLQNLSMEGYSDLDHLSSALGGADRGAAADAGRADYLTHLGDTQGRVAADIGPTTGTTPYKTWAGRAESFYQPRLDARATLIGQEGATSGAHNFDTGALQTLGDQQVDIGRRSGEISRKAQLMQAFRDRQLAADANKFKYQGPSSSFYNAQLFGQLANLAGTGIQAYSANGTNQPADPGIQQG